MPFLSRLSSRASIATLLAVVAWPTVAEELSLKEVASGIFVHQGVHSLPNRENHGEIANIGFVVGERCVAVIDSGGNPAQGGALRRAVQARTEVPICYVVNTHVHPDHIYGNAAFKSPGVRFVGHRKLAEAMAARAPFYMEKAARDAGLELKPNDFVPPDEEVKDRLELDLGGRKLILRAHGPAHTDNDLSIYDDKTQTFWLADLLFMEHIPVVDGSLNGWLKELAELRKVPARLAVPGHGPVASDWPASADREIAYLEMLREQIRALIKQGKTMETAIEQVGKGAAGDWLLFDEFHKRNISTTFAELEWED